MRPEYRAFLVGLVGAFLATIPGVSWFASLILFATAATIAALMRGDRIGFAAAWLGAIVRILTIVIPLAGNPEYGFEGALYIGARARHHHRGRARRDLPRRRGDPPAPLIRPGGHPGAFAW